MADEFWCQKNHFLNKVIAETQANVPLWSSMKISLIGDEIKTIQASDNKKPDDLTE
ncbi:hypothetical protein [Dickeya oryzae]|uniref:Uncharacterized protein n=1 Tax=Dickeya oryzae TaxID=1240404 RepID=A0AB39I7S0_9GAMM|nr:hypothetical protein [Dickeya oryzae]MCA6996591.1 hypothetical protein [Dickeya oryzae]